jgi:hypothetical protein
MLQPIWPLSGVNTVVGWKLMYFLHVALGLFSHAHEKKDLNIYKESTEVSN